MSLKPYPSYKDSGVEWVGDIPVTWSVKPLLALAAENRRSNRGMIESNLLSLSYGSIVNKDMNSNDGLLPESFETYQVIEPDDMVFRLTDLQNDKRSLRSALVPERGIITSAYLSVKPTGIVPRFIAYAMRDADLRKVFYSMGGGLRQSMKFDDMKRLSIVCPSPDEQVAIADFLDRETLEIDAFIADQDELIALLNERRKSALQTVTGSAVDGARIRLRYLYRQSRSANQIDLEILSVYREFGVIPKSSRTDNFNKTPEDVSRYLVVEPGYLVVNKMKAWQGSLGVSEYKGIVSPDYEVLVPTSDALLPAFAHQMLRSAEFVANYAVRSVGIRPSQWRLYWDQLKDIHIPVPSKSVQMELVRRLQIETAEIDATIADAKESIALSKERRAALISAAVTGKIDVRDAAASKRQSVEGELIVH